MNEYIQFKKSRELGKIITDIFKFLRNNYKVLFTLILRFAGPALVVLVLAYVFYLESTMGAFDPYSTTTDIGDGLFSLFISLIVLLLAGGLYFALLYGTVLSAIKSYVNNNGIIDRKEVAQGVRTNFWGLVGLSLLNGLMVGVGFLLCILPGVYIGVVIITTYMIMVFEKRSVSDSISYSFELIKGYWWTTFATLIVIYIIYYIVSMIFQVPQYIYFFTKEFTMNDTFSGGNPAQAFDWVDITLSSIGIVAQYLLQTFMVIASAFIYFDLNERKNFTGTIETIDSLGKRED